MRLLVVILTSSNIELLKRAIFSVKNQKETKYLKWDIIINVNTLNDNYYKEVLDTLKNNNFEIIRTESNGSPGKGHNSCLNLFKQRTKYNYLTILDGDDLFYPIAFQRFEQMIDQKPSLDLVHLMINDKVDYKITDETFNIPLKLNFKLYGCFDNCQNFWNTQKTTSPITNHLLDTKTPSRIILVSRNIFNKSIDIYYDEDLKLYDDMIAFFSFYELQLKGEINTFSTSESNIYCYNCLNEESSSYNLKKKEEENDIFKQKMLNYKSVLSHNWQIGKLPFIKLDNPNNFSLDDKIDFCNKYIIDFEISSKYYILKNVDINNLTEKNIELLLNTFNFLIKCGLDSSINIHNFIDIAIKKNKLNYVIDGLVIATRKYPMMSYWEKLFLILFELKFYEKCEYYYTLMDVYDILTDDIKSKYEIIKQSRSIKNGFYVYKIQNKNPLNLDSNKKIICYYTGYTSDFNGSNYGTKNVYGSEIAAINLCEQLTKDFNVIIVGNSKTIKHNNVIYIHQNNFNILTRNYNIDTLIISRYIGFTIDEDLSTVNKIYLLLHDTRTHDSWKDKTLPMLSFPLFKNYIEKVEKVVCVSKWQQDNFKNILKIFNLSIPQYKFHIIGNGINTNKFKLSHKKKNRFIYCSNPNRGLDILIQILIKLQQKYTDITLDIYFESINQSQQSYVNKYDWITFHGKVSNEKIAEELCKSDFWLYPNVNSHETFCISCVEAMCGGNVIITRDFSAPPNIMKDIGFLIPKKLNNQELIKYTCNIVSKIIENPKMKKSLQEKARKESLKYDWSNIASQWKQLIN